MHGPTCILWAILTACSPQLWTPFSLVCSSIVASQGAWRGFNAACEKQFYQQDGAPLAHHSRCALGAEWAKVTAVCDCGRDGCDGYRTPVQVRRPTPSPRTPRAPRGSPMAAAR